MQDPQRFDLRGWLLWLAGFLAFPIAGLAAEAVVGRIDSAGSALVGGLVVGAVIGTGQWLVARRLLGDPRYAVFGSLGAITFTALSGVLLDRLRASSPSSHPGPQTAIT